ncbi:auxin efflux carrier [Tothia fuscella]|uniref:Auxin efflux carrier n=1 Tax=Tothia fuscella TaxID=1048955 RepID=A0A9P4TZF7_9PEZI|nr:auxin efflux carrier [Tothia fuscella]
MMSKGIPPPPHASHPNFGHLCVLVLQAVLEVVFVAFPGYILARTGYLDQEAQKMVSYLNVNLFTPALIFYKLSSQLRAEDLPGLVLIPAIFILQTIISWGSGTVISKLFGFKKRTENFVVAMAVFGNSNSLPISLVTSLAFTIKGLHWDKEPHDNDSSVATRGITYLVIFQQLGQIIRWSWGYKILLRPANEYKDHELEEHERKARTDARAESGEYDDIASEDSDEPLIRVRSDLSHSDPSDYGSGSATPRNRKYAASGSTCSCESEECERIGLHEHHNGDIIPTPTNGNIAPIGSERPGHDSTIKPTWLQDAIPSGPRGWITRFTRWQKRTQSKVTTAIDRASHKAFDALPTFVQKTLTIIYDFIMKLLSPPLAAMLFALPIVLFPPIKHFFYDVEFMKRSFIPAVRQTGDVAVPLIIVCLGAGLARNTLPEDQKTSQDPTFDRKVLFAALASRMLVPLIVMAPALAIVARYAPFNILGDPIFIIVCFLLAGAPTALQLSQICQINNVYMGAMTRLLTQSYVVWILPSTIILVMLALETLEWAQLAKV